MKNGIFGAVNLRKLPLLQLMLMLPTLSRAEPLRCGIVNPLADLHGSLPTVVLEPGQVHVDADQATMLGSGTSNLLGHVHLQRPGEHLLADQVDYDGISHEVHAHGNLIYLTPQIDLRADKGNFNLDTNKGHFERVNFYPHMPDNFQQARGTAELADLQPDGVSHLKQVSYTTCPIDKPDWVLSADRLRLNQKSGSGYAYGAVLRFKDVPILYTPFFTFPLDKERESGFLPPSLGSSSRSGLEASIPYYWNIAPNQDDTIWLRYMDKRGTQLRNQYRFLTESTKGTLYGEYLPGDELRDEDRKLYSISTDTQISSHWQAQVRASGVSDVHYFEDLGSSISEVSSRYLDRRGDLSYRDPNWDLLMRVQSFQVVDPTLQTFDPYERLPQITFGTRYPHDLYGPLQWDLHNEVVRFAQNNIWAANRVDTEAGLGIRWESPGYFINPRIAYRVTGYQLAADIAPDDQSPTRSIPIASLDSGLFFNRNTTWGGRALTQTFEPRLFYLWVPYRNQNDIPVFDTYDPELNFFNLFSENRFTGPDRVSDANQVTVGATSRLLDAQDGRELLNASVAEIYRFTRPQTILPELTTGGQTLIEQNPDNNRYSNLLGNLEAFWTQRWSSRVQVEWDPKNSNFARELAGVMYRREEAQYVGLTYRMLRGNEPVNEPIRQYDLVASWPINERWHVIGRWNHSLLDDKDLETLAGLEYESCCWILRMAGRRYASGTPSKVNNGVFVQLELKGLAPLGTSFEELLNRASFGY